MSLALELKCDWRQEMPPHLASGELVVQLAEVEGSGEKVRKVGWDPKIPGEVSVLNLVDNLGMTEGLDLECCIKLTGIHFCGLSADLPC